MLSAADIRLQGSPELSLRRMISAQRHMRTTEETIERCGILNANALFSELLPEWLMSRGWTAEEKIINIDCEEELGGLNPEGTGMIVDSDTPTAFQRRFEMSFPVTSGFWVTIESLVEFTARSLEALGPVLRPQLPRDGDVCVVDRVEL